jgi:hypothetical protein
MKSNYYNETFASMSKHYTCAFSHLGLSGRCGCQFGAKDCIAEKEFGACLDENASTQCTKLYYEIRNNSDFVLNSHTKIELSVGQQSKIKMGGLLGLQDILGGDNSDNIDNIYHLVTIIKAHYLDFAKIPFTQLMPRISKFKFRKKP